MPRGSKPGERRGGRSKGTPNRVTLQKAAAIAIARKADGKRTAVEIMSEAANYFRNLAGRYQPLGEQADEGKFAKYLKLAADIAKDLAVYETPRLASTTLRNDTGETGEAIPLKIEVEYV